MKGCLLCIKSIKRFTTVISVVNFRQNITEIHRQTNGQRGNGWEYRKTEI